MNLEPPLVKKQISDFDSSLFGNDSNNLQSDDEDPYSFSSTSTSLIGLAIVFIMIGIPFLAVINERPVSKKITIPITSLDQHGFKSPSSFTLSWFSKSSC